MDRSFDLGQEYDAIIDDAMKTGRYDSPEDVMRESLLLLKDRAENLTWLNAKIQKSIDAADRGEVIDADEAFDRLDAMIREMAEKAA